MKKQVANRNVKMKNCNLLFRREKTEKAAGLSKYIQTAACGYTTGLHCRSEHDCRQSPFFGKGRASFGQSENRKKIRFGG